MKTGQPKFGSNWNNCSWIIVLIITVIIYNTGCSRDAEKHGWITYRHDGSRTGVTSEDIPSELVLKWTYFPVHTPKPAWHIPAEEMPRTNSDNAYHVSASKDLAYFGSSADHKVYAIDISTGKEKWVFFTGGPVRFSPTIWNNRIYFGSDDGYVYCLKARSGKMIWKFHPGPEDKKVLGNGNMISLWPVRTSVLVEDGIIYFGAGVFPYDGLYICALNAKNGSIIWKNDDLDDDSFELSFGGISPQSYIIASKTKLFVPSGRAMPAVFDRETGKFLQYLTTSGKQGGTWGMIDQGELVAGVDRSGTPVKVSFDAETGELKGDVFTSYSDIDMVGANNISYVVTEKGVQAVDRTKYNNIRRIIDSVKKEQNRLALLSRRIAYNASLSESSDYEEELDELTLQFNNLIEKEKEINTSFSEWFFPHKNLRCIILTAKQAIIGGTGIVIGLDRETGAELWHNNLEGTVYGLSISDRNLLVSTDLGPIHCFSRKPGKSEASPEKDVHSKTIISPYAENKMTEIYEKAAVTILEATSINKGYCLVIDAGEGQLVYELAKRSNLNIIGIENNPAMVKKAKQSLDKVGLYGTNVVVENWTIQSLPDYFADLIVSGDLLHSEQTDNPPDEIFRVLKPNGGIACFGQPPMENRSQQIFDFEKLSNEWKLFEIKEPEIINNEGNWILFTRMNLDGAGGWTHLYADPSNTICSDDKLVKAPFSTLWYGSPGPQFMIERHARAVSPLTFDGKLIIEGEDVIMAYDAYNGTMLWERKIKGANRVRVDADGGNMAINQYGLFVAVNDKCLQLDVETGETVQEYNLPSEWDGKLRRWGYIAVKDKILFGSVAMPLKQEFNQIFNEIIDENGNWRDPEELDPPTALILDYYKTATSEDIEKLKRSFQRDGTEWRSITDYPAWSPGIHGIHGTTESMLTSDGVFAVDITTGKTLWSHKGNKIAQITISIGNGTIFFADKVSSPKHILNALNDRQKFIANGRFEPFDIPINADKADVRNVYALDIFSGKVKWQKVTDLSGCGDDFVASGYKNGVLVFLGSYGLHDKWRFPAGQLKWHRITAISADNGDLMWSRQLNYMVRPLLINDEIIIEPRKCDLYTGEIKTRILPVTGKQTPWEFYRPGHTCAATSSNDNCLFYRSYNVAYYDLIKDKGISYYGAIRPGCWINIIPGNGLVLIPESSSGCTCSFPLRTTVVLKPEDNEEVEDWSLYVSNSALTPVQHLAINLGAPGDKKGNDGTLWFGYPRPVSTIGLKFDIHEEILKGMGYYSYDSKNVTIEGTDDPWLFTNGCAGLKKCKIQLIDDLLGEESGIYTVRLGFIQSSNIRKFNVKIQDNTVLEDLDILKEAGSTNKAVIKEIKGIVVENMITVEFISVAANPDINQVPVISFIEILREDNTEPPVLEIDRNPLNTSQIHKMLMQAEVDMDQKEFDKSLEKYHIVLTNLNSSKDNKLEALEGMRSIGSKKSLPAIKKYLQKLNPIIWNYKEPDEELVNASIKVFLAIANNMGQREREKAINMLNHSFSLSRDLELRYIAISSLKDLGTVPGEEFEENHFVDHLGCGKQVLITLNDNTPQYSGEDIVLTNGIKGTKDSDGIDWQRIPGKDLIATIDLEENMVIEKISVSFLHNLNSRAFIPSQVEFSISDNGKNFIVLSTHENDSSQRQENPFIKDFTTTTLGKAKIRYVRIKAKNIGVCPSWHTNSGEKAWLYCDEIQVY